MRSMPVVVPLAAAVLAGGAGAVHLDDLVLDGEAEAGGLAAELAGEIVIHRFDRAPAGIADGELTAMGAVGLHAGEAGIPRFDAVNEALGDEEIQRAINGRRHGLAGRGLEFG